MQDQQDRQDQSQQQEIEPRKTPYELLPGDTVRCVDDQHAHITLDVVKGQDYKVLTRGTYVIALEGVPSMQYAWRFVRIDPPYPLYVPNPRDGRHPKYD